jgi:hypothetical protein
VTPVLGLGLDLVGLEFESQTVGISLDSRHGGIGLYSDLRDPAIYATDELMKNNFEILNL